LFRRPEYIEGYGVELEKELQQLQAARSSWVFAFEVLFNEEEEKVSGTKGTLI
jgi:hypothetical protein